MQFSNSGAGGSPPGRLKRLSRSKPLVLASVLGLSLGMTMNGAVASPAVAAEGEVSGTVFNDLNSNGTIDGEEAGVADVSVTAFGTDGSEVGTATTGDDGTYSLNFDTGDESTDVRVEFSAPDDMVPARAGVDGASAGSTVQFVSAGDTADLGLMDPSGVDPSNTNVAVAIQRGVTAENPPAQPPADAGTIETYPYQASGNVAGQGTVNATVEQTGSIWGLDSANNWTLSSALFKRHSPVGPGGLGAIYLTDTSAAGPNAEPFVTIPDVGENPRGEDDGGEGYDLFHDPVSDSVGTVGLGDLDIAPDNSAMYVTNLNDRQLYKVPLDMADGKPQAGTPEALSLPLDLPGASTDCDADSVRPWAVHSQDDKVYAALTCTGPDVESLHSYIYAGDGEGDWGTAPVADVPLSGDSRGMAIDNEVKISADAMPWRFSPDTPNDDGQENYNHPGSFHVAHPQLILSNIRFDSSGDMVVGIKDRAGDQTGFNAGNHDENSQDLFDGNSAGDFLQLCAADEGTWQIEDNGTCGDRTGSGADNGRGHGGGEFYDTQFEPHDQTALGAVLTLPGSDEVLTSAYDPSFDETDVRTAGWRAHNSADGAFDRGAILSEQANAPNTDGSFGKAGGLGELTAIAAEAPVEIGNRVWIDSDDNGIQDPGEAAVEGVTVTLTCGETTAETTTDENGEYYFNDDNVEGGLAPSTDCELSFDATGTDAEGLDLATKNAGDKTTIDSDADEGDGVVATVSLTTPAAGADHSFDVGYVEQSADECSIGDLVWSDDNSNGTQDDGEEGVADVTVTLLDSDGNPVEGVEPVTTGDNGEYSFTGLDCDGTYTVKFEDPQDRDFTTPGEGDDPAKDSNPDPETGVTEPVEFPNDGPDGPNDDPTIDAGILPAEAPDTCAIGDYVWFDENQNGIQDEGEEPVADVTVALLDADGEEVATTTTDADGKYLFDDIDCATYTVQFTDTPEGTEFTTKGEGDDPATDSNPNPDTGITDEVTVGGENPNEDLTIDAGIFEMPPPEQCRIGDYVWNDVNKDGIQGDDEPAVPGVTVTLLDEDGNPVEGVDPVETDDSGKYLFDEIECGSYTVKFEDPEGRDFTSPGEGDDPAVDSNPDPDTGVTEPVEVTEEDPEDLTVDAGVIGDAPQLCTIGDYVWEDSNKDGIQNDDESPVPGVSVTLLDEDGNPVEGVDPVKTDDDGQYLFENIDCGTYQVEFDDPENRDFTSPGGGDDPAKDSNPDPATGITPNVPVTEDNPEDLTIDAGVVPADVETCSIGDLVWVDENGNGIQDGDESGAAGVTVTLLDEGGNPVEGVDPVTTDEDGSYTFETLDCDGTYTVKFEDPKDRDFTSPGEGDDPAKDSDPDPGTGVTQPIEFPDDPDSKDNPNIDAGLVPKAPTEPGTCTIGDYVWLDEDGNGIQDDGEPGVGDVTVTLLDKDGNPVEGVDPIKTDDSGKYLFEGIECGDYTVKFEDPKDRDFTSPGEGDDPAKDSNPDPATGITPAVPVADDNPVDDTVDAGIVPEPGDGSDGGSDGGGDGGGDLPRTGAAGIVGTVIAGLLLIGAGTYMVRVFRRRS